MKNESTYRLQNNVLPFYFDLCGDYYDFNLLEFDNSKDYTPIYYLDHGELFELKEGDVISYNNGTQNYFRRTRYNNLYDWVIDSLKGNLDVGDYLDEF